MNRTREIWNAGVTRWHASRSRRLRASGDCTDAHAARCARLLLCLHPAASAELLAAVLHHDVAESITGDVPTTAKQNATLRDVLHWMEADAEARLGLTQPRHAEDQAWLKLVDSLDAWLWAEAHDPAELGKPDWVAARVSILDRAARLGVAEPVAAIMEAQE